MKQNPCQSSGTKIACMLSKMFPVPYSAPFCCGISKTPGPILVMSDLTNTGVSWRPKGISSNAQLLYKHPYLMQITSEDYPW